MCFAFQEIKSALFYKDLGTAGGQRRRSVSFFKFSSIAAAQLPFFPYHHIHSIRFHHHTVLVVPQVAMQTESIWFG